MSSLSTDYYRSSASSSGDTKRLILDQNSGFYKISSNECSTRFLFELVYNVNNILQDFPYTEEPPFFVPTEIGEYISILTARSVSNICNIRNDSLSPWNRGKLKSKQHSFIVNGNTGEYRRADTKAEREVSNAKEYYAKHPDQKVTKKIFLALEQGATKPKPNTFVVIYYKVEENLSHQKLTNFKSTQECPLIEMTLLDDEEDSRMEAHQNPNKKIISMLDELIEDGTREIPKEEAATYGYDDVIVVEEEAPSTSRTNQSLTPRSVKRTYVEVTAPAENGHRSFEPANKIAKVPNIKILSTPAVIRKRHFGLFDPIPFCCDPPNIQNTPESTYIDQAAKNYYKANNLVVEAYHTSFPFELQKGVDLQFYGKRKCAHCNAEIFITDESLIITHYEPFEYLIPNSNHISTSHGNRVICTKFSCLKARYPFIDEKCFIVNNSVTIHEANHIFDLIF